MLFRCICTRGICLHPKEQRRCIRDVGSQDVKTANEAMEGKKKKSDDASQSLEESLRVLKSLSDSQILSATSRKQNSQNIICKKI